MIYPETVTRLRAPTVTDPYQVQVRDWANAAELVITGVQVQPAKSDEPTEIGRAQVITHYRLFSRPGVDLDILPSDRVRWNGDTYFVDGEVGRYKHPMTGAVHHVEAALRRAVG